MDKYTERQPLDEAAVAGAPAHLKRFTLTPKR